MTNLKIFKNICHPELVSGSKVQMLKYLTAAPTDTDSHKNFQILNQVQNDKIFGSLCIVQGDNYRKTAFTLSEVLITLGIIGVVAALTIPALMANVKGIRNRTQFKKTISTLHQAVRINKVEYEYDFSDFECASDCGFTSDCELDFDNIFVKNLKGVSCTKDMLDELYSYNGTNINDLYYLAVFILADGSIFTPAEEAAGTCSKSAGESLNDFLENNYFRCTGVIDINGAAGPNKEVECSNDTTAFKPDNPCFVKNSDITDIFPVVFHDDIVEPATNAAKYVLNTAK